MALAASILIMEIITKETFRMDKSMEKGYFGYFHRKKYIKAIGTIIILSLEKKRAQKIDIYFVVIFPMNK